MYDRAERPRRPAVPLAFHALVCVLVAERGVLRAGEPPSARVVALVAVVGLLVAAASALAGRSVCALALVVGAALVCALLVASHAVERGRACAAALGESAVSSWEFVVVGDVTRSDDAFRCRARARGAAGSADVWLTLPEFVPRESVVRCVGRFLPLKDDEWGVSSRMQGVWGSVRASRLVGVSRPTGPRAAIESLRESVYASLEPSSCPARALLAGCVCGRRDCLASFGLDELFSRCGIAHLVAVSGGHLSVLSMMLATAMEGLRLRRRLRVTVLVSSCGVFVLFCGASVSAVRAFLMTVVALVGGMAGRRSHSLTSVSLVALAMALVDPTVSGQLGFMLSVCAVCALCLLGPYASYVAAVVLEVPASFDALPHGARRAIVRAWKTTRSSVATSLLVMLATLPLVVPSFGEVSLVGPVANALLSVPFSAFVASGIVASALWWARPLQAAVLAVADVLGGLMLWGVERLAGLPMSCLPVSWDANRLGVTVAVLLVGVMLAWPRVSRRCVGAVLLVGGVALAAALVRWRLFAPARICVLDVGQGDAILVQDGAHALLVDAGPDESVVQALARCHVMHLDAVLVTHLHDDHYGGLASLVGRMAVDSVLVARGVASNLPADMAEATRRLCAEAAEEVSYGDVIEVGGFDLRVASPTDAVDGSLNAHSVELVASYEEGGRRLLALLTGDAEQEQMEGLISRDDVGDIDFLKVGHHGSEVSVTPAQAKRLRCEVAVASAGEGNEYGHPRRECVRTLEESGSVFLCTKDVGDVEVLPGERGPRVVCQRGGSPDAERPSASFPRYQSII